MADGLKRTGRPVTYWSDKLGVSRDELRSAVAKAGPMTENVREHLQLSD